jgi:hypothetical protein
MLCLAAALGDVDASLDCKSKAVGGRLRPDHGGPHPQPRRKVASRGSRVSWIEWLAVGLGSWIVVSLPVALGVVRLFSTETDSSKRPASRPATILDLLARARPRTIPALLLIRLHKRAAAPDNASTRNAEELAGTGPPTGVAN